MAHIRQRMLVIASMTKPLINVGSRGEVSQLLLWIVRVGVLLVLATSLIVTTSTLFPYVVGKAIFARSVIEITFAVWLILIFYYPQHRPSRSWVMVAFGIWLLVSLIASFTGVSPVRSLWSSFERMQGVIDRAHWFAFILLTGSVFRTFSCWRLLFTVNLGVGGLVSALGLSQYYGLLDSDWLGNSDRMESTLGNATYMGAYTMVNFIIGLGLIIQSVGRPQAEPARQRHMGRAARRRRGSRREGVRFDYLLWLRAFWLLSTLLCLWSLWLTATRGAAVGLGAGAITFAVVYIFWGTLPVVRRAAYVILATIIVVVILGMVARFSPVLDPVVNSSYMLQRLNSIGYQDESIRGRLSSMSAAVRAYQDEPILGWGPENYLVAWGRYSTAEPGIREPFDQTHNKVLEELTTTGTIGLLSYLLIWLAMASVLVRSVKRRQGHDQLLVLALSATLVAFFVQNLFLFDSPVTVMQLAILMAFVVSEEGQVSGNAEDVTPGRWQKALHFQLRVGDWRKWLRLRQVSRQLHTSWGGALLIVMIAALTIWALLNYNAKPYSAAHNAAQAANVSIASASWMEIATHFNNSVDEFPDLANDTRRLLITRIGDDVISLTDEEFVQAVDLVTIEGRKALKVEPQNWLIHVTLARFYQQAAHRNSEYLEVAGVHVREAIRLAPNTHDAIEVKDDQERLEQQRGL